MRASPSPLHIGSAVAQPGRIATGFLDAFPLPTGIVEKLPVIIAQGDPAGPVMWITTGVHGPEHTGIAVLHHLVTADLARRLNGTLIALPALSPAGLRTGDRSPYYHPGDPNRIFPGRKPPDDLATRSALEAAYARLFDIILETQPACLIDLHNAWVGSIPFVFRDPVFYRHRRAGSSGLSHAEARALHARIGRLLDAFGFTVINEFAADEYVSSDLHRSLTGSMVNQGGVPAVTAELGSIWRIDPGVVDATAASLRNVMRHVGLLDDPPEAIEGIPQPNSAFPVRRLDSPRMPQAGVAHKLVRPGEIITPGQPLVRITDIFGQPLGEDDGLLRSEYEGFVISWRHGIVHYQSDVIMGLAIRDENELVIPYPS